MTAVAVRRPGPVPPARRDWQRDAACARPGVGVDLTEIDEKSPPHLLTSAQALCASCPVLAECRVTALALTDMAGFAGGMTESDRQEWRQRRGMRVRPVGPHDVLPGPVAVMDVDLEATPRRRHDPLPDAFIRAVVQHTREGMSIDEITARLDGVLVRGRPVTASTVAVARAIAAGTRIRRTA